MDPNETLRLIRDIVRKCLDDRTGQRNVWPSQGAYEDDITALFEHVFNLDQWLSKGGFLPEAWTRVSREQIAKLQRKHEVKCGAPGPGGKRCTLPLGHPEFMHTSRLERVLKGEVVTCGKQADGYFCTKPKDHADEEHAALSDRPGAEPYFRWKDSDPECPVCGRISGHDSFAHGRDDQDP